MASTSSAKKVARVAAKSGSGRPPGSGTDPAKRRNWLFALGIVAIIGLGIGILVFARNTNLNSTKNDTSPKAQISGTDPGEHWHAAFALNVCGKELTAIPQPPDDPLGIHTHGDGLIHIHPFTVNAAGKRATMAKYWDLVGLKVTDDGFKDPSTGKVYKAGETTCGGKETELVMAYWKDGQTAESSKPDKIYTSDFPSVRFTKNFTAYTLALVPKGERDIPAPSSSAEIVSLGSQDGGDTSGSSAPPTKTGSSTGSTGDGTGSGG